MPQEGTRGTRARGRLLNTKPQDSTAGDTDSVQRPLRSSLGAKIETHERHRGLLVNDECRLREGPCKALQAQNPHCSHVTTLPVWLWLSCTLLSQLSKEKGEENVTLQWTEASL